MIHSFQFRRIGKYHFDCDEPPERGGEDSAPSPLEYFLSGTAFCLLSQVVQFAPLYQVQIQDARVDLRASFDDTQKYNLSGPNAAFQKVVIQIQIKSDSPREAVEALIIHAERGCHAVQSLFMPVPVEVRDPSRYTFRKPRGLKMYQTPEKCI